MKLEELQALMSLSPEEIDWLERRKSGDLSPRQHLRATELQARMAVYQRVLEGQARDALVAESIAMRDEIIELDMETAGMNTINGLNQRLVEFTMRVMREYPRER